MNKNKINSSKLPAENESISNKKVKRVTGKNSAVDFLTSFGCGDIILYVHPNPSYFFVKNKTHTVEWPLFESALTIELRFEKAFPVY